LGSAEFHYLLKLIINAALTAGLATDDPGTEKAESQGTEAD